MLLICFMLSCNKNPEVLPVFKSVWDEDVYFFGKNLEEQHKDLFHQMPRTIFTNAITQLRSEVDSLDKSAIITELMRILAQVGDAHTSIDWSLSFNHFPIEFSYFEDGVFISKISIEQSAYLMEEITGLNGISLAKLEQLIRPVLTHENESQFYNNFPTYLGLNQLLVALKVIDKDAPLTVELANGGSLVVDNKGNNPNLRSILDLVAKPLYLKKIDNYYWSTFLEKENLFYLQYNQCQEKANQRFEQFTEAVMNQLDEQNKDLKLVVDLRNNGGGNSNIAKPLIEALTTRVNNNTLLSKNIYVVIGKQTFSSAVLNTIQLEEALNPVLIGEPTGGKPNHFGEVKTFTLPNSGLTIRYSSKYFNTYQKDADADSIYPDIELKVTSKDFKTGEDPILNYIINQ